MKVDTSVFSNLSDVRSWDTGPTPLSPFDFVALEGKPSLLFAYAALLSPSLTQVNGRFFLSNGFNESLLLAWSEKGVRDAEAQRVINHVHMKYLMQEDVSDIEVLDAAAVIVSEIWKRTLPAGLNIEIVGQGTEEVAVTFAQD